MLIALIVVAVTVGQPLTYLNCQAIGVLDDAANTWQFTTALGNNLNQNGGVIDFGAFAGATKTTCLEMKSVWGLSISLCILFAFSLMCTVCLWRRKPAPAKSEV
jgi:hypothetical protein